MKLDIQVELRDAPGQLGNVLNVVGRYGGNILSVHHERGHAKGDWVPVRLVLEVSEEGRDPLVEALREEARVLTVAGDVRSIPYAFLLLGHVFQGQLNEVTDAVFGTGAEVRTVRAEITARDEPSAVLVEIAASTPEILDAARDRAASLAKEKGLTFVGTLSAEAPPPPKPQAQAAMGGGGLW